MPSFWIASTGPGERLDAINAPAFLVQLADATVRAHLSQAKNADLFGTRPRPPIFLLVDARVGIDQ